MAIIQKRADELKPGDVLHIGDGDMHAVLFVEISGMEVKYQAAPTCAGVQHHLPAPRAVHASYVFAVESPDLTPAQERAEELAELLGRALRWQEHLNTAEKIPSWAGDAGALLLRITPPEPPTLAEALELLVKLQDIDAEPNSAEVDALLDRARRAKVMP